MEKDCGRLEDELWKMETKKRKKDGEKKREIWVDVTGSKSPNSIFLDGIYQAGAEGVMVFLFS